MKQVEGLLAKQRTALRAKEKEAQASNQSLVNRQHLLSEYVESSNNAALLKES